MRFSLLESNFQSKIYKKTPAPLDCQAIVNTGKMCLSCWMLLKARIIFCSLGCSVGGGGDQKIPTYQELPELLANT